MDSQFTILNPCSKRWDELSGGSRARFCETCQTPVHALRQYSSGEWERLWKESNGHVCGYLGGDPAPERRSRRVVLLGAFFTAISPLFAQDGRVRIRVTDITGAVIPSAEVQWLDKGGKPAKIMRVDKEGEIAWTGLPMGTQHFVIRALGFKTRSIDAIVSSVDEARIDATLDVSDFIMGVIVEVRPTAPSDIPERKTIESTSPASADALRPAKIELEPPKPQAPSPKRKRWWIF